MQNKKYFTFNFCWNLFDSTQIYMLKSTFHGGGFRWASSHRWFYHESHAASLPQSVPHYLPPTWTEVCYMPQEYCSAQGVTHSRGDPVVEQLSVELRVLLKCCCLFSWEDENLHHSTIKLSIIVTAYTFCSCHSVVTSEQRITYVI